MAVFFKVQGGGMNSNQHANEQVKVFVFREKYSNRMVKRMIRNFSFEQNIAKSGWIQKEYF